MDEQAQQTHDFGAVLKELSDIKSSLAVNNNETANIKESISEIKTDIKEIKNDFVSRREFNDSLKEIRESVRPLKQFVYGIIGTLGIGLIGAALSFILRRPQ